MEKQKQINEIADIIFQKVNGANFDDVGDAAVAIYKADYRKRTEGESIAIIIELESKLHTMLPFKAHPILIDDKYMANSYELGKEHVIYDILNYLGELEKKYTEATDANH
jgi:hypothetical protein